MLEIIQLSIEIVRDALIIAALIMFIRETR